MGARRIFFEGGHFLLKKVDDLFSSRSHVDRYSVRMTTDAQSLPMAIGRL